MTKEQFIFLRTNAMSNDDAWMAYQEDNNAERHAAYTAGKAREQDLLDQIAMRDKVIATAEQAKADPAKLVDAVDAAATIRMDATARRRSKIQEMILVAQKEAAILDGKPIVDDSKFVMPVEPRIKPESIKE